MPIQEIVQRLPVYFHSLQLKFLWASLAEITGGFPLIIFVWRLPVSPSFPCRTAQNLPNFTRHQSEQQFKNDFSVHFKSGYSGL